MLRVVVSACRRVVAPASRALPPMPGRRARRATAAAYGQSPTGAPRKRSGADVKGMRRELAAVLDEHEGSREVFRYLAHFERQLGKKGLPVLDEMSVKRLRRALAQFEAIVTNWSSTNLADLRSRMAVAVSIRDSGAAVWLPGPTISHAYTPQPMPMVAQGVQVKKPDFADSRQLEVHEISLARLQQAIGEWSIAKRGALMGAGEQATSS
ncbi:MAG TPA: hypothetical protein VMU47_04115 [Caldimonas sp.]|nr:hypothetical protein [Caldimonas sp.]